MKRLTILMLACLLVLAASTAYADVLTFDLTQYQSMKEFDVSEQSGTTVTAKTDTGAEMAIGSDSGTVIFDVSQFRGNQAAFQLTGVSAYENPVLGDFGGVSVFWQESMVNDMWSGATSVPVMAEEATGTTTTYIPFEIDGVGYARLRIQFLSAVSEFSGILRIFRRTE